MHGHFFFVTRQGQATLYAKFYNHVVRVVDIKKILLTEELPDGHKFLAKDDTFRYIIANGEYNNYRKRIPGEHIPVEDLDELMNIIDQGNYQFGRSLFGDDYIDNYNVQKLKDTERFPVLLGPYFRVLDVKSKNEMQGGGSYLKFSLKTYQTLLSLVEGLEHPDL